MRDRRSLARRFVVGVVVLVIGAAGLVTYEGAHRGGISFTADFTGTVGLYSGSDVRMLGVPVGKVEKVSARGTTVEVRMHLDRGRAAAAGTAAVILSPSLVSDRYVQLTQIWTSGPKLADGAVIPASMTATPVELDQLYSSLTQFANALGPNGANKNGAFSQLLRVSAANLNGNGTEFGTALDQLSKASATLAGSKDDLFSTVSNLKTFTTALANSDSSVSGLNTQLAAVSQVLAADRQSFSDAIAQLGTALGLVQTFVSNNRGILSKDVAQLSTITQTLVAEKASLSEALQTAPSALGNLLSAYDPTTNRIVGRGDLNELSIWAGALDNAAPQTTQGTTQGTTRATSPAAPRPKGVPSAQPPSLLPAADPATVSIGSMATSGTDSTGSR